MEPMNAAAGATWPGAIEGEFAVDQNGNAMYSIGVNVPPGTGGMAPSLSLVYHSALNNGMLGPGWSLQGLSAILRTGRNPAQDGGQVKQSIRYDSEDRLVLDGVRMVAVSGSYGAPACVYHTEIQSWQRISTIVNGFVSQAGNGTRQEYGVTEDALIRVAGPGSPVRAWAVSRVVDACGNFMTISYRRDPVTTAFYPLRIAYTGNTGLQPARAVEFTYETRPDIQPRYESGCAVHETLRLTQIGTSVEGRAVLNYKLDYQAGKASGRSQLRSVTLSDGQGRSLPATRFDWLDMEHPLFEAGRPLASPPVKVGVEVIPCDLKGTGRRDLITAGPGASGRVMLHLMISGVDGQFFPPVRVSLDDLPYSPGCILPLDIDGDGATELIHQGVLDNKLSLTLLRVTENGGVWKVEPGPRGGAGPRDLRSGGRFIPVDVDGDGRVDAAYCFSDARGMMGVQVMRSTGSGFELAGLTETQLRLDPGVQLLGVDFSGNGMSDLLYAFSEQGKLGLRVLISNGNRLDVKPESPLPADVKLRIGGALIPVRLKGDDQDDLVYALSDDTGKLILHTFLGTGTAYIKSAMEPMATGLNYTGWILPMAMRGAGLTELAIAGRDATGKLDLRMVPWNGTAFAPPEQCAAVVDRDRPAGGLILPADLLGQGKSDLLFASSSGGDLKFLALPAPPVVPDRISRITDGSNGGFEVVYKPLTDPSVYDKGDAAPAVGQLDGRARLNASIGGSAWPLQNLGVLSAGTRGSTYSLPTRQFAEYVVASSTASDGRGNAYRSEYRYLGCRIDASGRGWLGFSSREVHDVAAGTTSVEHYHQMFPATSSMAVSVLRQTTGGHLLTRETYAYQTGNKNGVHRHDVSSIRTERFTPGKAVPDTMVTQSRAYDAFGNITLSSLEPSSGNAVFTLTEFTNREPEWLLGRPVKRTQASDSAGKSIFGKEEFTYELATVLCTESRLWDDVHQTWLLTRRAFDIFGNAISVTDPAGAVTSTEFDSHFRTFPVRKILPIVTDEREPAVIVTEHEPAFGEEVSSVDTNGTRTRRAIDSLGRLIATEGPDPGGNQVTLSRNSWGTDSHGSFTERSHRLDWSADLWHWERVYTDGLGREFRRSMPSADGRGEIVFDRVFGSSGEVLRESIPHLASETPLWIEHSYDILGRATETSSPAPRGGRRTNRITYPHVNQEKITEGADETGARTSSREYAEFGEERCLVKSVDAGGAESQYDYDELGRVLTATDPGGVVTTSRYDSLGRRVSMRVAKAEKVFASETVIHNDSKRSKIVTTARGNQILLEHDTRGRLVRRAVSGEGVAGETTAYKYTGDRLARVEMPGDMTYTFAWDGTGNVSAEDIVIGGRALRITRTYTPTGKVAKMVYPDGAELHYRYTPQGQLAEQTLHEPEKAARSIASFSDFTNAGRPRSILYGNGLKEELAFNRLGQIESQRLGTPAGANPLAHTEFNWDNFDQLAGITDRVKPAHSQAFAYDANGRLIEARWNAAAAQALQEIRDFSYDAAGNIISKNGVKYSYQGHQLVEGRKQGQQVFSAQYDADGGMAKAVRQDEVTDYQYDGLGRMTGAKGAKFLYDHSGRRVMKQSIDATTWYVSPDYEFTRLAAGGEQTTKYIPGDYGPLAQITTKVPGEANASAAPLLDGVPEPGISYFHTNLINSTSVQTDGAGAVLATITYEPFGEIRSVEGRDSFRPKFTGKELDHETGLYYFNSRYYDPVVGRFLSADDRPGADLDSSGALNRYAYVLNNPVTGIDFDGHFRWDIFADVLIGIAAVTLLAAATVATGGAALAIGLAASTLLGAAISGSFYSATHSGDDFSWSGWGIEVGIGGATGLISGAIGGAGVGMGARAYVATVGAGKHFLMASGRQALRAVAGGVVKQVARGFAKQLAWSVAGGIAGGVASQFVGNSLRNAANGLRGTDAITTGLGPALVKGVWQGAITGALGALPLKPKFAEVAGRRAWAVSSIIKSGFAVGMASSVAGLMVAKSWADNDRAGENTNGGHRATQPTGMHSQAPLRFTPLGLVTA